MRAHVFVLACLFCAACGRRVQTNYGESKDNAQSSAESIQLQSAGKSGTPFSLKAFALLLAALDPSTGFHVSGLSNNIAARSVLGVQHQSQATRTHVRGCGCARCPCGRGVSMSATSVVEPAPPAGFAWAPDNAWESAPSTAQESAPNTAQDFLEFEPYHDKATMPNNVFKPKDPFTGSIKSVKKITKPGATGETYDIVIDHGGEMPYIEGQSYGVIPPGTNPKNGKPNTVRLYSIASSRYGDDMTGTTTTLCVRRATYWCPELKAEDPAKKGVCSNYLCDAKAGDLVKLTGPTGKVMLLPEEKPETDIIMVATGTGIAPFRSFLRRIFVENTPYAKDFKGLAWLFLGVANSDGLLYDDDWKAIQKEHPDQFRYDVALSREQTNKDGEKMYIQDRVEEYADEIFERLDKGAHIYFCGLKGMMPGIQDMLAKVAKRKGLDYEEFIKKLKSNHQWHVEVY